MPEFNLIYFNRLVLYCVFVLTNIVINLQKNMTFLLKIFNNFKWLDLHAT